MRHGFASVLYGDFPLKKMPIALALVLALTGCQATQRQNATTGEYETNSTTQGALIGAIAGAAIGLATGDDAKERRQHALIGAAAGGATGAGVGYYFDQQEAELRRALLNSGVQVQRVGENQLLLRMENGIGFSSSSYQLDASIHNTLRGVARILVDTQIPVSLLTVTRIAQVVSHTTKRCQSAVQSPYVNS